MKRVAKAFLSLALIAAIVLGNAHFVYADGRNKNDSSSRTVTGKTSVINAQYSSDQNQEKALDDILMADYSYVIKENESNTAVVDMKVTLYTRSDKYLAEFSGAVDLIELPSGFAFWEGPLDGTFLLDDKEIRIIVGFLQKKNSEDICLSFTFCVEEEERGEYPVLFSIGEGFITDAVNEEILSFQNDYTTGDNEESNHEDIDISPETNNRSTTLLFSSTRSTLAGVEIQTTKCYFEYATNRVLIGLKSNTNYATQYYSSMASSLIATYVNHLKYNLVRTSGTSHISGIEKFDLPSGGNSYNNTLVSLLFSDALNLLGIPTNTFQAIMNNLKGNITLSHATNNSYVEVNFGLLQYANFDSLSTGVPAVFQLIRSTTNSQPPYNYTVSTELRYRSYFQESSTGYYLYHYLDANNSNIPVSIPVQ